MKKTLVSLLVFGCCGVGAAWSQTSFQPGDRVDVDVIMAGAPERAIYRPGTVLRVEDGKVFVRLDDGDERSIPFVSNRTYWVKAASGNQAVVNAPRASQSAANPAEAAAPRIAATSAPAQTQAQPSREDPKPAGLGAPPNGVYNAHKISPGGQLMGLGKLEIQGNTYRGIAGGPFSPYAVAADGNITWSSGLTGMPKGWTYVRSVYVGNDYRGRPLIKVYYRSSSGWNDAFDCVLDGQ